MDLETENRIAAILMKEAAELRRQAEKDGVNAYLRQPNVRGRPNSRFLTATVLGVQQANRVVEVNEMWRIRQKEQELDDRLKRRQRDQSSSDRSYRAQDVEDRWKRKWSDESSIGRSYRNSEVDDRLKRRRSDDISSDQSYREQEVDDGLKRKWSDESSSDRSYGEIEADDRVTRRPSNRSYKDKMYADGDLSSKESSQKYSLVEEGLKDDEIDNFLKSRVKRGRGAIGSRMDETGPYLPPRPLSDAEQLTFNDMVSRIERDRNAVLGPEKPSHLVSWSSSEEESTKKKNKKAKKVKKDSSSKHSRKHKSNGKSKDKSKKKRKEDRRHKKQK